MHFYSDDDIILLQGDAFTELTQLPDNSVDCVVTSPPYFCLRDYGIDGQYGLETSPADYVENLRKVFAECRRVLTNDGTCWVVIGDSYSGGNRSGLAGKNLLGIPWRFAFALQDDGWVLRNAIVWHKPNGMPASVRDRFSNRYEHVFLFSKAQRYWFDLDPVREPHSEVSIARSKRKFTPNPEMGYPGTRQTLTRACAPKGKNPGDVWRPTEEGDFWSITTKPFPAAHFACFPPELPRRCILTGCKPEGVVLDPFSGSGTTGQVALELGRHYIGIDLNPEYLQLSLDRRLRPCGT